MKPSCIVEKNYLKKLKRRKSGGVEKHTQKNLEQAGLLQSQNP